MWAVFRYCCCLSVGYCLACGLWWVDFGGFVWDLVVGGVCLLAWVMGSVLVMFIMLAEVVVVDWLGLFMGGVVGLVWFGICAQWVHGMLR